MPDQHLYVEYGQKDFSLKNFTKDQLSGVRFIGTTLVGARFDGGTNYFDVTFEHCNMIGAVLDNAAFSGTLSFKGSNLTNASLRNATHKGVLIPKSLLAEASSLSGTILPDGTIHHA